MPASPNEKLREEITGIIYGADWKEQDIYDAFKPDVEAVMKLICAHINATLQSLIDEGPKENSEEFWHMSHFVHDIGCIPELERQAEINGSNTAIAAYRRLIESKMKSDTKLIESKKGKADPIS